MRRRTYLLWKNLLTRLAILLSIAGALYVYFFTHAFTIQHYVLEGIPESYASKIRGAAYDLSNQKIAYLFPGNRVLSFHHNRLKAFIKETLPNSEVISIRPSGLHSISIEVVPYTPLFAINTTQAVSEDGIVYTEIGDISMLPRLEYASTTKITTQDLANLSSFVSKIDTVLFEVRTIVIDEHGDIRLYDASRSTYIALEINSDFERVWSNVLSAIDTEPLKSKIADHAKHIEYLDARFGNKVFYKFTNTEPQDIIPPDATSTQTTSQ